ncbi:hypothetical protein P691DRAFT_809030 [Macrolepiota fuliginosa MF-IS2]|uniref:Uncharacterized protein n=1 Tax=Macrolepiota fuliginosa MF-IS2 TaxID=1400762 RepID=A0A9P5XHV1_9AGAR|nr:hypothetical protein P691DRAFT_809030 [Macrolepiota fuliginosa MF-IS2]
MFGNPYAFFTKVTTKKTMSLNKPRKRRDSFGLQLGKDGTVTLDLPGAIPERMLTKPLEGDVRRNGGSSRATPAASSSSRGRPQTLKSRKSAPSLPKVRQRRDSFGLEVRVDGTLSLDQLGRDRGRVDHAGTSEARSSENNETNYPGRSPNTYRSDEAQGGSGSLVREGRGQSSDRRNNREESRQSIRTAPQPVTPTATGNRSRRRLNEGSPTTTSENIIPSTETQRQLGGTRSREVLTSNSEINMLRERVRVLEAALIDRAPQATQTGNSDTPPAYESRPSSPVTALPTQTRFPAPMTPYN